MPVSFTTKVFMSIAVSNRIKGWKRAPTYPPPTGERNGEDNSEEVHKEADTTSKSHGFEVSSVGGGLEGAAGLVFYLNIS